MVGCVKCQHQEDEERDGELWSRPCTEDPYILPQRKSSKKYHPFLRRRTDCKIQKVSKTYKTQEALPCDHITSKQLLGQRQRHGI